MKRVHVYGLCAVSVTSLAVLGWGLSHTTIYDGIAAVQLQIEAPAPVRAVDYELTDREEREAVAIRDLLAETGYLEVPRSADRDPWTIRVWTWEYVSALGLTQNTFGQFQYAVLRVELENGERWAVLLRLPDVREFREATVAIPGPDARRITAPVPEKPR